MLDRPLLKTINLNYYSRLLNANGIEYTDQVGTLFKIRGFDNYNFLLDINRIFSTSPNFELKDRTGFCASPLAYAAERPWTIPTQELTLDQALQSRVQEIISYGQKVNIFWSGGIDSTAIVTAFLKHAPDLKQIRIIYSPWSTYEHPGYLDFLKKFSNLELIDQSGDLYLHSDYDGFMLSGNGGDEMHASLDESFVDHHGYDVLNTPWKDFFYKSNPDANFIEFCEKHFAQSGREITTVLHARWWFYSITKITGILNQLDLIFHCTGPGEFNPKRMIGFLNCDQYENFIYFNLEKIQPDTNYASWRQFLKDYCFEFDKFEHWHKNKTKFHSAQLKIYQEKKQILNDKRWLMLLEDGTRIHTKNLPLFSQREWIETYQHKLEYLFNKPINK